MDYYKIHVEKDGTITNTGGGEIPSNIMEQVQDVVQAPILHPKEYSGGVGGWTHYEGDYIVRPSGSWIKMAKVGHSLGWDPESEPWRVPGGPAEVPENWRELLEKQEAVSAAPGKPSGKSYSDIGNGAGQSGGPTTYHTVPKPELVNGKLPPGYRRFVGVKGAEIYGYSPDMAAGKPYVYVPQGGVGPTSAPGIQHIYAHPELYGIQPSKVITINKGVATPVQNVSPEELADIQKALSGGTVGEKVYPGVHPGSDQALATGEEFIVDEIYSPYGMTIMPASLASRYKPGETKAIIIDSPPPDATKEVWDAWRAKHGYSYPGGEHLKTRTPGVRSRAVLAGETFEVWARRIGAQDTPYWRSWYLQDKQSRGLMTPEEQTNYLKKQGWSNSIRAYGEHLKTRTPLNQALSQLPALLKDWLNNYPRLPQSTIPTPKDKYPVPGRPPAPGEPGYQNPSTIPAPTVEYAAPGRPPRPSRPGYQNPFAWRRKNNSWW